MLPQKDYTCTKTWYPSQEFSSRSFWNLASKNHIFPRHNFCQRVVHYMLIVLLRYYFIKWTKRKVPGFKESYCYSSVLSYFACGKTRLICRKLKLNNKYTKKDNYIDVLSVANIRLLMLIRDSCVIQTKFS